MNKLTTYLIFFLISLTITFGQTLCPPSFLNASPEDREVSLFWSAPDTVFYGDILLEECFSDCDSAINAFSIEYSVDNNSGGWFRNSSGDTSSCGTGMIPCNDGGSDNYSAIAVYSSEATPVDSRLITGSLDLTNYTTAILEFVEGYAYSEDAWDSNMVEISTDSGATWDVVYSSLPWDIGNTIIGTTIDLSSYAGQSFQIAFRYFDATGYGEAWYVDNIRVWGGTGARTARFLTNGSIGNITPIGKKENGLEYTTRIITSMSSFTQNSSDRTSPCGTFQTYNIYANGNLVGSTEETTYIVDGLINFTEYCFNITAQYAEGESDTSYSSCATPLDPFIVDPDEITVTVGVDEYIETTIAVANHDTIALDFSIFSMEIANLEVAVVFMEADFNMGLWDEVYESEGLWLIGDSTGASSSYLPYPESDGLFAYYNDDFAGEDTDSVDSYLTSNIVIINGNEKIYLMLDMFYPQWGGPCGNNGGYADFAELLISTDGGNTWTTIDSSFSNWFNGPAYEVVGWDKLLYNITPYTTGNQIIQVAVHYTDCGGNWGYGIGVDNIVIKHGDDYSWLTLSPYEGTVGAGDTIDITVGVYGIMDGFSANETAVLTASRPDGSTAYEVSVSIGMSVGESGVDIPEGVPGVFALHQNYPNPFNPVTSIRFDIPELSFARMEIYNLLGQRVRTLFHGAVEPGYHITQWDGKNDNGEELPSGMYLYKLHAGSYIAMEKLVLLK